MQWYVRDVIDTDVFANAAALCALPRPVPLVRCDGANTRDGVVRGATQRDLESVARDWTPHLQRLVEEDADWDWASKMGALMFDDGAEFVALIGPDGVVEAMLLTSLPTERPALSELGELPLYVEYVATAPWNRPTFDAARRFKALGPTLLRHAVFRSAAVGRGGRIALHSLPRANDFYVGLGLNMRGVDVTASLLNYYEGDAEWARAHVLPRKPTHG